MTHETMVGLAIAAAAFFAWKSWWLERHSGAFECECCDGGDGQEPEREAFAMPWRPATKRTAPLMSPRVMAAHHQSVKIRRADGQFVGRSWK